MGGPDMASPNLPGVRSAAVEPWRSSISPVPPNLLRELTFSKIAC